MFWKTWTELDKTKSDSILSLLFALLANDAHFSVAENKASQCRWFYFAANKQWG